MIQTATFESPLGPIRIAASGGAAIALAFKHGWSRVAHRFDPESAVAAKDPAGAVTALRAYFDGELDALDRVRFETGGTPFQRRMWDAMRQIPPGQTWSYRDLAMKAGFPDAIRAAGTACGANPVWLVVPCHRVWRADGGAGNYGGGVERKRALLEHERLFTA